MIPRPGLQLALIAATLISAAAISFSCGKTQTPAVAGAIDSVQAARFRADSARMAQTADRALQAAIVAQRTRDSAIVVTDSVIAAVARRVPKEGVTVQPSHSEILAGFEPSDFAEVCIRLEGCYPAHQKIAALAATQDSVLQQVVHELIPSVQRERATAATVITAYQRRDSVQAEAIALRDVRIAEQAVTIRTLTPTARARTLSRVKDLLLFGAGLYFGSRIGP